MGDSDSKITAFLERVGSDSVLANRLYAFRNSARTIGHIIVADAALVSSMKLIRLFARSQKAIPKLTLPVLSLTYL